MAELRINAQLNTAPAMAAAARLRQVVESPNSVRVDLGAALPQLQRLTAALAPGAFRVATQALRELGTARIEVAHVERLAGQVRGVSAAAAGAVQQIQAMGAAARARLVGPIGEAIQGVAALVERWQAADGALRLVMVSAAGVAAAVWTISAAVAAATGGLSLLVKLGTAGFSLLMAPVKALGAAIRGIWSGLSSMASGVIGGIRSAIGGISGLVGGIIDKVTTVLSPGLAMAGGGIMGYLVARILGKVQADTGPLAAVKAQVGAGADAGTGLLQSVLERVSGSLLSLVQAFEGLLGGAPGAGLADVIAGYVRPALDWLRSNLTKWADWALRALQQTLRVVDGVVGAVLALIAGDWAAVGGALAAAGARVIEGVSALLAMLAPQIDAVVDWVARAAGDLLGIVGRFIGQFEPQLRAAVAGLMDAGRFIIEAMQAVKSYFDEYSPGGGASAADVAMTAARYRLALGADEVRGQRATPWGDAVERFGADIRAAGGAGIGATGMITATLDKLQAWLDTQAQATGAAQYLGNMQGAIDAIDAVRKALGTGAVSTPAGAVPGADSPTRRNAERTASIQTALGTAKVGAEEQLAVARQALTVGQQQLGVLKGIAAAGGGLT